VPGLVAGIAATTANIGFYGGLLFALFLIGWGLSLLWGPIADRYGRVRTLSWTILFFSVFTFLSALATNVWALAIFRMLAGIGIGGEWSMAGTFVAEEWPEKRRLMGAGWMHTGYYFGFFLAALGNYWIGGHFGWRAMFVLGGTPALLVAFIRYGVAESERWANKRAQAQTEWSAHRSFLFLFSDHYRRRTLLNATYVLVSIIGLWAGSVYVPAAVTFLAAGQGLPPTRGVRLASYASIILSCGTILGCLVLPKVAEKIGRRATLACYFALMMFGISIGFGYVFYLKTAALPWFMVCLFFLGLGGGNFAMYTLWLPEQYRTECRASAFAFSTSVGRFVGAGMTFLVGAGVRHFQTIGLPVALTAIAFAIGLLLIPLGEETRGQPLPA